jgi:hypothetical protein
MLQVKSMKTLETPNNNSLLANNLSDSKFSQIIHRAPTSKHIQSKFSNQQTESYHITPSYLTPIKYTNSKIDSTNNIILNSPNIKKQNNPTAFNQIGYDIINSNRVIMNNFNKKPNGFNNYVNLHSKLYNKDNGKNKNHSQIEDMNSLKTIMQDHSSPLTIDNKVTILGYKQQPKGKRKSNFRHDEDSLLKQNTPTKPSTKTNTLNISSMNEVKTNLQLSQDELYLNDLNGNLNNLSVNITSMQNKNANMLKLVNETISLDSCVNFLKPSVYENWSFKTHLRLFEVFVELELFFENSYTNFSKIALQNLTKKYFLLLKEEYCNQNQVNLSIYKDSLSQDDFFNFQNINKLYSKAVKYVIIILSILLLSFNNLFIEPNIKSQLRKLFISISYPMINIFEYFIFQEISIPSSHNDLLLVLKPDFLEKYLRSGKNYRINKGLKFSDIFFMLSKNLESCLIAIKQFSK